MVQWLELRAFTAEGQGSVPGLGTKIPQASWRGQKKKNSMSFNIKSSIFAGTFPCKSPVRALI